MLQQPDIQKVVSRLNRIEGQVSGIRRMVQDQAYCVDLLNQIAAVQAALGKVGAIILENHMETCVQSAFESGNPEARQKKIDELLQVFSRYGRIGAK